MARQVPPSNRESHSQGAARNRRDLLMMVRTIRGGHHRRPLLLCNFLTTLRLSSSLSSSSSSTTTTSASASSESRWHPSWSMSPPPPPHPHPRVVTIGESSWRDAASRHSRRIESLLRPGMLPPTPPSSRGRRRRGAPSSDDGVGWTALDPVHPVYNFLIEYYGLGGTKGTRRLARWSPDPRLLLLPDEIDGVDDRDFGEADGWTIVPTSDAALDAAISASNGLGGIILENASMDDLGDGTLHLRGGVPVPKEEGGGILHGMLYHPGVFYGRRSTTIAGDAPGDGIDEEERLRTTMRTMAPFQWYASILRTTLDSDPVLHCHGLHEWAMLYHPDGADPPPSATYQRRLGLRVSRDVINGAVERRGVRCTHVDALRFFAPAAGPLNRHGAELARTDQLRLEQKGCVHAHMDMLKIGLKLGPFVGSGLMADVLGVALDARRLDVAASPYDVSAYGLGAVPIETSEGRRTYREEQVGLMRRAEPVRERLLVAYESFMSLAFDERLLGRRRSSAVRVDDGDDDANRTEDDDGEDAPSSYAPYVAPERLATARPGGLPWRRNIVGADSEP